MAEDATQLFGIKGLATFYVIPNPVCGEGVPPLVGITTEIAAQFWSKIILDALQHRLDRVLVERPPGKCLFKHRSAFAA